MLKKILFGILLVVVFLTAAAVGAFYFSADFRKDLAQKYVAEGKVFEQNNDLRSANISYQKAKLVFPGLAESHLALASLAQKQGNAVWAKAEYQKVLKIEDNNQLSLYELGKIALAEAAPDSAKNYFAKITDKNISPSPNFLLAQYFVQQKNFQQAKAILQNASDENSSELAEFLTLLDAAQSASTCLEKVPALVSKNQNEIALALANNCADNYSSLRDAWIYLAYAQLANKNFKEATSSLEKAKILDPVYPYTFDLLAFAEEQLGENKKASDDQSRAEFLKGDN